MVSWTESAFVSTFSSDLAACRVHSRKKAANCLTPGLVQATGHTGNVWTLESEREEGNRALPLDDSYLDRSKVKAAEGKKAKQVTGEHVTNPAATHLHIFLLMLHRNVTSVVWFLFTVPLGETHSYFACLTKAININQ